MKEDAHGREKIKEYRQFSRKGNGRFQDGNPPAKLLIPLRWFHQFRIKSGWRKEHDTRVGCE